MIRLLYLSCRFHKPITLLFLANNGRTIRMLSLALFGQHGQKEEVLL